MVELELFIVDKNDTSWSLRAWLVLAHGGIPFTESSFVSAQPETPARLRAISPTGRVPVLRAGARLVRESLAIVETLAEPYPEHPIWPRDGVDAVYALPAFQRWEREARAELAERPVAAHIGAPFAGPVEERIVAPPSYAVIFESERASEPSDYAAAAERMDALAPSMPGYQGHKSAPGADGFGMTVSYWDSLENIAAFRAQLEHAEVQRAGRARYYSRYDLRVARVQKHVAFDTAASPSRREAP